jgi:hypothetical protein
VSAADDGLERRYRRLLRAYPAAHRSVYAEEMVTVLMSGAAPEQRRPGRREALGLIAGGFGARLRAPLRAVRRPAWSAATGLLGYLICVLLAAVYAYDVAEWLGWHPVLAGHDHLSRASVGLAAVWTVAAVAAARGWRLIGTAAATAGTAGIAVMVPRHWNGAASPGLVVLAATAAVSLGLLARPTRPAGRPAVAVAVAAALCPLAALFDLLTVTITRLGEGDFEESPRFSVPIGGVIPGIGNRPLLLVAVLALLATLGTLLYRLGRATRGRMALLASPVAAAYLVLPLAAGHGAIDLLAGGWFALVAVSLLTLALGTALSARARRRPPPDPEVRP